ncbi:penicillin-binding protein 2 [Desulfitobacterium sp. THU1]|uniref:penicillin-binding protein 2 n=1 Tax=Desulfitobacterium sp. THU1 TaxID=3138072 RepID=UPI00311F51CB
MEEDQERKPYTLRLWALGVAVFLVFLVLSFNLWRLQIAEASYYESKAQGNIMKLVSIPSNRGDIIDRNGELLVTSVPQFALTIDWMELQSAQSENWKEVITRLAGYIKPYWPIEKQGVEFIAEDILVMIQNQQWERYRPVTVMSNVPDPLKAIIAEHKDELPGVNVEALPVRDYRKNTLAGHLLGYVREVSEEEIDKFNQDPYAQEAGFTYTHGDLVGKMGVEKSYDYWLRGREGVQQVIVDNSARPIAKEVIQPAEPGKTLQLTLDAELQAVMEKALDDVFRNEVHKDRPDANAGAAVVIEVKTGKILGMTSRPFMNPNDLTGIISEEIATRYFTAEEAASFDRALAGTYAPGSTFKMTTALAGLHSGVVTPSEQFNSSNVAATLGTVNGIQEWSPGGFGLVNLNRAMAKSSNTYFQAVGQRVFAKNGEMLKQIANELGLGVYSGVDIPGESKGNAPSPEWKKATFGPAYEKTRDNDLAEIEKEFKTKLAEAKDEDARKKLENQKKAKIDQVHAEYNYNVRWFVDWQYFETFNTAIGQGDNTYTPLQLANYVATVVNGGKHMQPYIVDKILDPVTGEVVHQNQPVVRNTVSVSPENLKAVKEAMSKVTSGEGTAAWLFADIPQYTGGGKTGTAQIGSKNTAAGDLFNGVYVGFAPYDDPEIAFAGVVEYGYHGGDTAGLIAKAAFKQYFGW